MTANFRRWLKKELDDREWGVTEASRRLGVSHGLLSTWLSGDRNPSARSLHKVADGLNLPLATVFEAAGLLPPGDAPDPASNYARVRGLVDAIDWDDQKVSITGTVGYLVGILDDQRARHADTDPD